MSGQPDGADTAQADRALTAMLRALARDVAHELRGPVQSVVVNVEVLKRRAARGMVADVESRADVLEQEVRRLHGLADAFLSLLRPATDEPATMPVETLLAGVGPLIETIARSRRVALERAPLPEGVLVRIRAEPAATALVRFALALCDGAGDGGTLALSGEASDSAFSIRLELRPGAPADVDRARGLAAAALADAKGWIERAGGTADVETGSDSSRVRIGVRLPRAT